MEKKNGVYTLGTSMDLQMSVQIAKITTTNDLGKDIPCDDEILFNIFGYDSNTDQEVESMAFISKQEAKHLIIALEVLIGE